LLELISSLSSPGIVDLLVFSGQSNSSSPSLDFLFFLDSLSSDSGFSDESLDLGSFVSKSSIGILFALESSSNNVFFN